MTVARISGAYVTAFGKRPGSTPLGLMAEAALGALDDAGLERNEIDGLITGYATTQPHLMYADLFAETFGLDLHHAHAVSSGGATGAMMVLLARHLVAAGACRRVLVVAGENRATGQSRAQTTRILAEVGHPTLEVSTGATVPAYYALLAARYLAETGATEQDLAALAVQMRAHAQTAPGAQFQTPITVADVMASRSIAAPLKLLDCCSMSDGAAAIIVSADDGSGSAPVITGYGEAHTHQHIAAAPADIRDAPRLAANRAFATAGRAPNDMHYLGIYDSFTPCLALLLEGTGFAPVGQAGKLAASGYFDRSGPMPLNTHGGLLSYGHPGVAGGLAIVAEAVAQLRGRAGPRQVGTPQRAYVHNDGGVLSANVGLVLEVPT